jgi:hypothetical protein
VLLKLVCPITKLASGIDAIGGLNIKTRLLPVSAINTSPSPLTAAPTGPHSVPLLGELFWLQPLTLKAPPCPNTRLALGMMLVSGVLNFSTRLLPVSAT